MTEKRYQKVTVDNFYDYYMKFVEIVLNDGEQVDGMTVVRGKVFECEDADDNDANIPAFCIDFSQVLGDFNAVYLDQIKGIRVIPPMW